MEFAYSREEIMRFIENTMHRYHLAKDTFQIRLERWAKDERTDEIVVSVYGVPAKLNNGDVLCLKSIDNTEEDISYYRKEMRNLSAFLRRRYPAVSIDTRP